MATITYFSLLFTLFLSFSISVRGSGFSVNLIHRDSPESPFHNPLDTLSDRMQKAVHRSINRVNHFKKLSSSTYSANLDDGTISTSLSANDYEFVMNISIGTPPRNVFVIADTGSDITWVQCTPCANCYRQVSPLFDPKTSSTYKDVPCASETCKRLIEDHRRGFCENELCQYIVKYVDDSSNTGNLAFETITFASTSGRSVQLPNIAFGCGHDTGGSFNEKVSGLVGLGGGKFSLISQLGSKINSKFSYCLVPKYDVSSKFIFGSNAEMTGEDVLSTSLISKPSQETYYYLTLKGISVNDKMVLFSSSSSSSTEEEGDIVIDSGSTLTYLPEIMYSELESEFVNAIDAERISGTEDFNLCYALDESMRFPDVTIHFTDADIKLGPRNYFVPVSGRAVCLTFAPTAGPYIYGNQAQINFLIEYSLEEKKVSFKPTDCTKQG